MKKQIPYNRRRIMKRAHNLIQTLEMSKSEALQIAWTEAKLEHQYMVQESQQVANSLRVFLCGKIGAGATDIRQLEYA